MMQPPAGACRRQVYSSRLQLLYTCLGVLRRQIDVEQMHKQEQLACPATDLLCA